MRRRGPLRPTSARRAVLLGIGLLLAGLLIAGGLALLMDLYR